MEILDHWNLLKKNISARQDEPELFPQKREVWMCAVGQNIGFEQNGGGANFSRPVLVVKKFNNKMFWVVPLSTKQKRFDFYHNYTDPNGEKVSAVLAQLRLMSVKRFERLMYEMPANNFRIVSEKLEGFLRQS